MLYLYKNQLDIYEVIDDVQSKETVLLGTRDFDEALDFFQKEIKKRRKTTLMSFDGKEIINYVKD